MWEKKSLLHWINSLPIPSCALFSNLTELKDGTILYDIVRQLRPSSEPEPPLVSSAVDKIQNVLQYINQQGSPELQRVFNESSGFLSILNTEESKMIQLLSYLQQQMNDDHVQQPKDDVERNMNKPVKKVCTTQTRGPEPIGHTVIGYTSNAFECSKASRPTRVLQKKPTLKKKKPPGASKDLPTWNSSVQIHDNNNARAHAYGPKPRRPKPRGGCQAAMGSMIDPTYTKKKSVIDPTPDVKDECQAKQKKEPPTELVHRVCQWIRSSMGLKVPCTTQCAKVLSDGVLLCQVVAFAIQCRGGGASARATLVVSANPHDTMILSLKGACARPRSRAERQHNISLALSMIQRHLSRLMTNNNNTRHIWSFEEPHVLLHDQQALMWELLDDLRHTCEKKTTKNVKSKEKQRMMPKPAMAKEPPRMFSSILSMIDIGDHEDIDARETLPSSLTREQIRVLERWFVHLGFNISYDDLGSNHVPLLQDPVRNGVLLCLVVKRVDHRASSDDLTRVCRGPLSIHDVRGNFIEALTYLHRVYSPSDIPRVYFRGPDHALARGQVGLLWGLFWCLYQIFSCQNETRSLVAEPEYALEAQRRLEAKILRWIARLGDLKYLPKTHKIKVQIETFADLQTHVSTGLLLASIAHQVFGVTFSSLHLNPVSPRQRLANVERVCEKLRKCCVRHRYLAQAQGIVDGHRLVILGVLEDLRFFAMMDHPHESKDDAIMDEPRPNICPTPMILGGVNPPVKPDEHHVFCHEHHDRGCISVNTCFPSLAQNSKIMTELMQHEKQHESHKDIYPSKAFFIPDPFVAEDSKDEDEEEEESSSVPRHNVRQFDPHDIIPGKSSIHPILPSR